MYCITFLHVYPLLGTELKIFIFCRHSVDTTCTAIKLWLIKFFLNLAGIEILTKLLSWCIEIYCLILLKLIIILQKSGISIMCYLKFWGTCIYLMYIWCLYIFFLLRDFQGRTAVGIRGALRGRGRGAAGSRGAGNQRANIIPGLMGRGLRRFPHEVSQSFISACLICSLFWLAD